MLYRNGKRVKVGDRVRMVGDVGTVVCSIDDAEYSEEYTRSDWGSLKKGVLINFPKFGLIHYEDELEEDIEPIDR
jgi:hypothetical protein